LTLIVSIFIFVYFIKGKLWGVKPSSTSSFMYNALFGYYF